MFLTIQKKRVISGVLLCLFLILSFSIITVNAKPVRIVVLCSYSTAPYQEAYEGFKQYLNEQGAEVNLDVYDLNGDKAKAQESIQKISKDEVRMIYTLGSFATNEALDKISGIPIIAGLVLKTDTIRKKQNATGTVLDFPIETQFEMMRRFLPEARSIGVLFSPENNREFISEVAEAARKMRFDLVLQEVRNPKDLPDGLKNLTKTADALWGINDPVVYTPETAKHILLFSYRNQIPFIGLSSEWVKAGALYSLDRDYKNIGKQCGEMAFKVLQGAEISSLPIASPRDVAYSLNLKTAKQMKIDFSDSVIKGAQTVY